jgi:hypothetical protein
MMGGWALQLDDVVVSAGDCDGDFAHVRLEATRDGVHAWTLDLDATGGRGELMARMRRPQVVAGRLIVCTDGEHSRGASSHEPQVHVIDATGTVCWSKPWRVEGAVVAVSPGLLMLVKGHAYPVPATEPVVVARLARRSDGKVRHEWPVRLPPHAAAALAKDSWPRVRGEIVRKGGQLYAVVEAGWRGGTERVHTRLTKAER